MGPQATEDLSGSDDLKNHRENARSAPHYFRPVCLHDGRFPQAHMQDTPTFDRAVFSD